MSHPTIDSVFAQVKATGGSRDTKSVHMSKASWQAVCEYLDGRRTSVVSPFTGARHTFGQTASTGQSYLVGLPVVTDESVPLGEAVVRE